VNRHYLRTAAPQRIAALSLPYFRDAGFASDPDAAGLAYLERLMPMATGSVDRLGKFARLLCQNFPQLQAEGHPKWREVQLALPDLPRGWAYYAPMQRELKACIAEVKSKPPAPVCTQQAKILGLCK
jgi:hypothetical protein